MADVENDVAQEVEQMAKEALSALKKELESKGYKKENLYILQGQKGDKGMKEGQSYLMYDDNNSMIPIAKTDKFGKAQEYAGYDKKIEAAEKQVADASKEGTPITNTPPDNKAEVRRSTADYAVRDAEAPEKSLTDQIEEKKDSIKAIQEEIDQESTELGKEMTKASLKGADAKVTDRAKGIQEQLNQSTQRLKAEQQELKDLNSELRKQQITAKLDQAKGSVKEGFKAVRNKLSELKNSFKQFNEKAKVDVKTANAVLGANVYATGQNWRAQQYYLEQQRAEGLKKAQMDLTEKFSKQNNRKTAAHNIKQSFKQLFGKEADFKEAVPLTKEQQQVLDNLKEMEKGCYTRMGNIKGQYIEEAKKSANELYKIQGMNQAYKGKTNSTLQKAIDRAVKDTHNLDAGLDSIDKTYTKLDAKIDVKAGVHAAKKMAKTAAKSEDAR